jgi:RNA polymerase-binding transcription factor DksA
MNKKDIQHFTDKLIREKKILEDELGTLGKKDPRAGEGWEATTGDMEVDRADENEVADKMEELEENQLILGQLEKQLVEVNSALEKIQNGTFGICTVCNEPVENDRLEANPSATTCKAHMK